MSFSPSVRRRRCSQVEQDVLRQAAAVRRYAPRVIRIMRAQQSMLFPGMARDVLAPPHLSRGDNLKEQDLMRGGKSCGLTSGPFGAIDHHGVLGRQWDQSALW